jgi:uncharacterized protein YecT (DUF1311 family)
MNRALMSLFLSGPLLLAAAVPSAKEVGKSSPACRSDERIFRGKCVTSGECCVSDVCNNKGEVFEFGGDGPKCVPCANVNTQQEMNFCAQAATTVAEQELDVEYKAFRARFPERASRVGAIERAWKTFRDRTCDLEASEYEGGSMQPQVHGECMARETRSHLEWMKALRTEWSNH